jgi:hypothetical protein
MRAFLMTAAIALTVGTAPAFAQSSGSDASGKANTNTSSSGQYTGGGGTAGTSHSGGTAGTAATAKDSGPATDANPNDSSATSASDRQNSIQSDDNGTTKADKGMTRHRTKVSRHMAGHDSDTASGIGASGTANATPSPPISSRAYTNGATGTSDNNGTPHH